MGTVLSHIIGGGAAAAVDTPPEDDSSCPIISLHKSSHWRLHFNTLRDGSQLLVVDFSATWCGPCRFIEPKIRALAENFSDVSFVKIDVDELKDVAEEYKVQAMPTFVLLKRGKEVDRIIGAKHEELEGAVTKHRAS